MQENIIKTKADERFLKEGGFYDDDAAKKAISFIEDNCIASRGYNANNLIELLPWQRDLLSQSIHRRESYSYCSNVLHLDLTLRQMNSRLYRHVAIIL